MNFVVDGPVVDKFLGEFPALGVSQFKVQVFDAPEDHRPEQAQRRRRRNQDVPTLRRALPVTDDFDVLVEQLAAVEQLVKVHDPVPKVVNLFENTAGQRVVEIQLPSWKLTLVLDSIPVAFDERRQSGDERPALLALHGTAQIYDRFHVVGCRWTAP